MKKKENETTQEETPVVVTENGAATPENINSDTSKTEEIGEQNPETNSTLLGIKVVTNEEDEEDEEQAKEALPLEPLSFISADGNEYQITVPKFRFKSQEYDSQETIDKTPEVLEVLIKANVFFIKKL